MEEKIFKEIKLKKKYEKKTEKKTDEEKTSTEIFHDFFLKTYSDWSFEEFLSYALKCLSIILDEYYKFLRKMKLHNDYLQEIKENLEKTDYLHDAVIFFNLTGKTLNHNRPPEKSLMIDMFYDFFQKSEYDCEFREFLSYILQGYIVNILTINKFLTKLSLDEIFRKELNKIKKTSRLEDLYYGKELYNSFLKKMYAIKERKGKKNNEKKRKN